MANTEVLLTIGIIISAAIILFQLASIFTLQSKQVQKSLVVNFARELESRVDKAAAATQEVNFTYSPELKKYNLNISNNVISIKDKISGAEINFFKLTPQIVRNSFEDSNTIYIVRKEGKILIFADYQSEESLA